MTKVKTISSIPKWHLTELDWAKRLAHGHKCQLCPRSSVSILDYETMKLVWKVLPTVSNRVDFGDKLFSRKNYTLCCEDCAATERVRRQDWYYQQEAIKNLMSISKARVTKIKEKKDDTYKQTVMKMNGIDQAEKIIFKIYKPDDFVSVFLDAAKEVYK